MSATHQQFAETPHSTDGRTDKSGHSQYLLHMGRGWLGQGRYALAKQYDTTTTLVLNHGGQGLYLSEDDEVGGSPPSPSQHLALLEIRRKSRCILAIEALENCDG
jgi:hypothetical protein